MYAAAVLHWLIVLWWVVAVVVPTPGYPTQVVPAVVRPEEMVQLMPVRRHM
jgi:hypothetical protein